MPFEIPWKHCLSYNFFDNAKHTLEHDRLTISIVNKNVNISVYVHIFVRYILVWIFKIFQSDGEAK